MTWVVVAIACTIELSHALATFTHFRSLSLTLRAEWEAYLWRIGGAESLKNAALLHHKTADAFCRQRAAGCTWAEHHALVDHSRAPYAGVFDSMSIPLPEGALQPRPTKCSRLHKPNAEALLDLVQRSQPAVLSGLLDGWPALERWTDAYLAQALGDADVALSVSDGRFDHPEPAELWGLRANATLAGIVARPAHVPMKLSRAMAIMLDEGREGASRKGGGGDLVGYLEYLPIEFLQRMRGVLETDLRAPGSRSSAQGQQGGDGRGAAAATDGGGGRSLPPLMEMEAAAALASPPPLSSRGELEIGRLPLAEWLIPRKHLLWLGGGGTVGSTHFDPYENLMAVLGGSKTFHLASPEEGHKIGGHRMMAEGGLRLEPAAEGERGTPRNSSDDERGRVGSNSDGAEQEEDNGFLSRRRLVRSPEAVGEPLDLHHYATASLGLPPDTPQPGLPRLAEVARFSCEAHAGDVLYTPAYWWHEVHSRAAGEAAPAPAAAPAGTASKGSATTAGEGATLSSQPACQQTRRRSVVALNWFFEPFYIRTFANRSFERSPHYALIHERRPLDAPFPPRPRAAASDAAPGSGGGGASRRGPRHDDGGSSAPGSFYARLRERQGAASRTARSGEREKMVEQG